MSKNKVLMRLCEDNHYGDLEFLADTADSLQNAASQIEAMGHKIVGQGEQVYLFSIIPYGEKKQLLADRVDAALADRRAKNQCGRRYEMHGAADTDLVRHILIVQGANDAMILHYQDEILEISRFGLKVKLASRPGYYTHLSIKLADE